MAHFLQVTLPMVTPKRLFKITATISLLVVIGLSAYGLNYLKRLGPMPAGYVSQTFCSGLFIAERDYDDIYANDITNLQRHLTHTQVEGNISRPSLASGHSVM